MVFVTDSSEPLLGHSYTAPCFMCSLQQGELPIIRGVLAALRCRLSRAEDTSNLFQDVTVGEQVHDTRHSVVQSSTTQRTQK